jgi:hypothetical protein
VRWSIRRRVERFDGWPAYPPRRRGRGWSAEHAGPLGCTPWQAGPTRRAPGNLETRFGRAEAHRPAAAPLLDTRPRGRAGDHEISPGVESGWLLIGEEVGYIVDVTAEMMIKDQATPVLRAGDPFLIPPRTPHSELDRGPEMGGMFPTYIVEVGQPLATFTR